MTQIFTLIIGVASIYFFYEYNFVVAVLLLVWALSRLFGFSLQRLAQGVGALASQSESEKKTNATINLKINVAEVFKHKLLSGLFEKLSDEKNFPYENEKQWREALIENFKEKYKNSQEHTSDSVRYIWEEIKFNIKNNLLWKNGEIDFNDSVYSEWYIPYTLKTNEDDSFFTDITDGVTIRLLIVNGIIKLQVGDFNKETSPKILRDGGLAVYQRHATITSFPLMYTTQDIPQSYLNATMYATDSYWEMLKGDDKTKDADFTKDWKDLNVELADYNYIYSIDDEIPDQKKFGDIIKRFHEKSTSWIKREGFKDPYAKNKDDDYYTPGWMEDNNINYCNKYLQIFIANIKEFREKREQYSYPDYWEETP